MDNSVYVALSKQTAADRQLEVIANNMANSSTVGYKSEDLLFKQYLAKDSGGTTTYVDSPSLTRNNDQGELKATGNPLDFAIQGNAYFGVQTPSGEKYTKAGNFIINQAGQLSTTEGYPVVDQGGATINFEPEDKNIVVYDDGRVEVDGQERGALGSFSFPKGTKLEKVGNNLLTTDVNATAATDVRIAQGMLEQSNVNPILEMTKMINVQRDFERTNSFISTIYDLQDGAIKTAAKEG